MVNMRPFTAFEQENLKFLVNHNYEEQLQGQEHKAIRDAVILTETSQHLTQVSFYRQTTKKGDPRMWIYKLGSFTEGNDMHVLFYFERKLYSINITHIDIADCYNSPIITSIKEVLMEINHRGNSVSEELMYKFRSVSGMVMSAQDIMALLSHVTAVVHLL